MSLAPLGLAACLVLNPEFGGEGATGGVTSEAASAGATGGGTSSAAGSEAGSATATDGSSGATSDASTASAGATTEPPPPTMRLQHYMDGQCDAPLWCFQNGQIFNGAPARMFAQECFAGVAPPLRIRRIGYWVAATRGTPSNPAIEVRGFDGVGPGPPLVEPIGLGGGDVDPGYHEVELDVTVMADTFCVGLAGGDQAQGTSLGVAVDDVAPPPMQSFYRVDALPPCNSGGQFRDTAIAQPTPTAQWCIHVEVEPL